MTTGMFGAYAGSILVIGIVAVLLPHFSRPTLAFGVRIPPEQVDSEFVTGQRRRYQLWVLAGSVVLLAVQLPLVLAVPEVVRYGLSTLPILVVAGAVYYRTHRQIRAAKQHEQWYSSVRQGIAVDTTLHTDPERFPWWWALPAVAVLVGTALVGILRYPEMPDTLVMQWSETGQPGRTVAKTPGTAFAPVFVQAGLTALVVLLTRWCFRARPELDPARPTTSARQHRRFTVRTAKAILVLAACTNLTLLGTTLMIWTGTFSGTLLAVSLLPVLLGVVGLVVLSVRIGQGGSKLAARSDEDTGFVAPDDDRYWKLAGLCYVNRDDPAVFVQKRVGFGWTINCASPKAWSLLAALLVGMLLPLLLA